jgi:hypothetical protein
MWKIVVGFIAFAAFALYVLSRGGDIDMSGEKHGTEATHAPEQAAPAASAAAPAVSAPAAMASEPAKPASAP